MEKPSVIIENERPLCEYTDEELWHIYVEAKKVQSRISLEMVKRENEKL